MSWINRLSVWSKLMLSFVAVSIITVVVGYVGITRLTALNASMGNMYEDELGGCIDVADMSTAFLALGRDTRQVLITVKPEDRKNFTANVEESVVKFNDAMKRAEATFYRPEGKARLDQIRELFPQVIAANRKAIELREEAATTKSDAKQEEAVDAIRQVRPQSTKLIELLAEMSTLKRELAATAYKDSLASATTARIVIISCIVGGALLSLGLGLVIARWFTKAITQVDEIATGVASASQELAAASEQLSSGAQQSASSLEETASSLEEMTATVRQNADNADQANQLANSSRETAEKGGAVVANAVRAMGEINQASRKIADIITTIDEIAFQTNLLALNAAVEAARAGEQGRGFAVVAGEVRNLAQRSATAAKEIKGLIEDSVTKVESGSALVNQSGETLDAIVSSVKRVTDIVGEIAAASREQSAGIDQINKAVAQMDTVTQSNASQTEEMSGTAVALSGQAEQLQAVVAQFNLKKSTETETAAPSRTTSTGRGARKPARQPASRSNNNPRPQPKHELELVGAGAGGLDGFTEF